MNIYSCGPTVYDCAHIGNLRSYIFIDEQIKQLKKAGNKIQWGMNITDIDDKTIAGTIEKFGSKATVDDLKKYTEYYEAVFKSDLEETGCDVKEIKFLKITSIIPWVIYEIKVLLRLKLAYHSEDGIYFDLFQYNQKYEGYGKLMGSKFFSGLINVQNFVLWKYRKPEDGNIFWPDSELGEGRPGWHIECVVAMRGLFGPEKIDIHTGGVDLRFPHHSNEIALSNVLFCSHNPPHVVVKEWRHVEHLSVDGKKMSKSLGNTVDMRQIKERGFSGLDFRHLVLGTANSYKKPQNFTWEALAAAAKGRLKSLKKTT